MIAIIYRCHPFQILKVFRKHMITKVHCKVHGGDDEEEELEKFFEYYSSSYIGVEVKQFVASDSVARHLLRLLVIRNLFIIIKRHRLIDYFGFKVPTHGLGTNSVKRTNHANEAAWRLCATRSE